MRNERIHNLQLIHSTAQQSRPVVIIVFTHVVRTSDRPYVDPTFQNQAKQNKYQVKTMFTTGEIVGVAEWIIDDTCLVLFITEYSYYGASS